VNGISSSFIILNILLIPNIRTRHPHSCIPTVNSTYVTVLFLDYLFLFIERNKAALGKGLSFIVYPSELELELKGEGESIRERAHLSPVRPDVGTYISISIYNITTTN